MKYSAVIELLGVRDLAGENPEDFDQKTRAFMDSLALICEKMLTQDTKNHISEFKTSENNFLITEKKSPIKKISLKITSTQDRAYLCANSLDLLNKYIEDIRFALATKEELMIRSILFEGEVTSRIIDKERFENSNDDANFNYNHVALNTLALEYSGLLQKIKGIGVDCNAFNQRLKEIIFENIYMIDDKPGSFRIFTDLIIREKENKEFFIKNTLKCFKQAVLGSTNYTKYFISIFFNLVKNTNYYEEELEPIEKVLFNNQTLFRSVPGHETLYLALLEQSYSTEEPPERLQYVRELMIKTKWIHKLLKNDVYKSRVPVNTLSGKNKRKFMLDILNSGKI